jgi:hypothetical protein
MQTIILAEPVNPVKKRLGVVLLNAARIALTPW